MVERIECIALRTVRVNDSRNLLSVWCRGHGRLTVAMPAGRGREALRRRALTAPLALFEAVSDIRADREIISVRDLAPMSGSPAMCLTPVQFSVATFLAEALDVLLRRTPHDEALSSFLFDAMRCYGVSPSVNFHVSFLCHLTEYLGIAPDVAGVGRSVVFDLREGRFCATPPLHGDFLSQEEGRVLRVLLRVPLERSGMISMRQYDRRRALDVILHYYSLHLCELEGLQSVSILRQIFD